MADRIRKAAIFTFLDLPAEARVKIYECSLVKSSLVRLELRGGLKHGREVVNRDHHRNYNHRHNGRFQVYDAIKGRWVDAPPIENAIIIVNKQIYLEATAVLYAGNRLSFKSTTALDLFLDTIAMRAQKLRCIDIEAGGYIKSSIKPAMLNCAPLLRALNKGFANSNVDAIQTLQIHGYHFCCWSTPRNFGKLECCIQEVLDDRGRRKAQRRR